MNSTFFLVTCVCGLESIVGEEIQEKYSYNFGNSKSCQITQRKCLDLRGHVIMQVDWDTPNSLFEFFALITLHCWTIDKVYLLCVPSSENLFFSLQKESFQVEHLLFFDEKIATHFSFLSSLAILNLWNQFTNKSSPMDFENDSILFRITAKRSGNRQSNYTSLDMAKQFADFLEKPFPKWRAQLHQYQIEFLVYIRNEENLFVAITLEGESISKPRFFQTRQLTSLSLRPSIAYSMFHLVTKYSKSKQNSDYKVMVDLCCGSGSLPLTTVMHNQYTNIGYCIGGDLDKKSVEQCSSSVSLVKEKKRIDYLNWNFKYLPLRSESVDIVISNLPFGKQCSSHGLNRLDYPIIFQELIRVTKKGSLVCILTVELKLVHKVLQELSSYWKCEEQLDIVQGGLTSFILVLSRV